MKDIPKHYIVAGVLFVVLGLLGGAAWFWTGTQLATALEEKQQLETQLQAVSRKGVFPSRANLEKLQTQTEAIDEKLRPVLMEIQETGKLFDPVRGTANEEGDYSGISANEWKKLLGEKRDRLLALAQNKATQLPENFYLGFSKYRALNPAEADTYLLGIQLFAIEEMVEILLESSIDELNRVARVTADGDSAQGSTEGLAAQNVEGPAGLYTVYPFELSFKASPDSIFSTINRITDSKYFFIIRFIDIENEKTSVPRRSEVISDASSETMTKLLVPVVGQEKVQAVIRVDLIVWKASADAASSGGEEES